MYDMYAKYSKIVRMHYNDVIMTTMGSQITSRTVVYSNVYSDADQRKHQNSASLAFVWDSPGPVNSPYKGPITRKMFPFDDVIMIWIKLGVHLDDFYLCKLISRWPSFRIGRWMPNNFVIDAAGENGHYLHPFPIPSAAIFLNCQKPIKTHQTRIKWKCHSQSGRVWRLQLNINMGLSIVKCWK